MITEYRMTKRLICSSYVVTWINSYSTNKKNQDCGFEKWKFKARRMKTFRAGKYDGMGSHAFRYIITQQQSPKFISNINGFKLILRSQFLNLQLNTCNVLCNEGSDDFLRATLIEKYWFNDFTFGMEDKEMHVIHSLCLVCWAMTLIEQKLLPSACMIFTYRCPFFIYMREDAIP